MHTWGSHTKIQAASTLGSASSIDFEEQEVLARTLPTDEANASIGATAVECAETSGQTDQFEAAEAAQASSSALETLPDTQSPVRQNGAGTWKLRFPLPRWKQKRLVRQVERLPPAPPMSSPRPQGGTAQGPAVARTPPALARTPSSSRLGYRRGGVWAPLAWLQQRFGQASRTDYVRIDFRAPPKETINPFQPSSWPKLDVDVGTFWGLLVLSLAYVHHSTTGFALPALLPLISPDLHLTDSEGALLTVGYTLLYAVTLIPAGYLADKADRPRLLAAGLALWSVLTMAASKVTSFHELLLLRVGFAAAQATQNPICFSLIPELFPRERTTAMAAYNSAIYMGRALSFAAVIIAGQLGVTHSTSESIGVQLVPLDAVDLSHVSILYTQGEMAAITPIYDYNFQVVFTKLAESSWRTLLFWLGPPGLVVAGLCLLTLAEPRQAAANPLASLLAFLRPSKAPEPTLEELSAQEYVKTLTAAQRRAERKAAALKKAEEEEKRNSDMWASVRKLVKLPSFQAVTAAAAMNDVGSWALVSFQATFYSRVYDLGPDVYAPALAAVLPIGGIIGGVTGGLMGDWLSRRGGRQWLTAGATIAAAPVLVVNLMAPDYHQSLAALLVGFALSEMWRAPAAIMIRDVSPPNLGSTGSAVHLCVRNLIGGLGPLAVAGLEEKVGLQQALLIVPTMYLLSGIGFFFAERVVASEKRELKAADSFSAR
ncbi:g6623 [Coccomyxa elongata]